MPRSLALLALVAVMLAAPTARAQATFRDTIEVTLDPIVEITPDPVDGCDILIVTVGTFPDPVGRGLDGDYTYRSTLDGRPYSVYYAANYPPYAPPDSPGNAIAYAAGLTSSGPCDGAFIGRALGFNARIRSYAIYSTTGGPVATYRWQQTDGLAVAFDGTRSYVATPQGHQPVASYAWAFGDGQTGTGAAPSHTYTAAGDYTAVLTVRDAQNRTDTYQTTVRVTGTRLGTRTRIVERSAQVGDTLTVVGTVENAGTLDVRTVQATASFSFATTFPDSVRTAETLAPEFQAVPEVTPPPATRSVLAAGDTLQVQRRYVLTRAARYRRGASGPYTDVVVEVEASLPLVRGVDASGAVVPVVASCGRAAGRPGVLPPTCERNVADVGPVPPSIVVTSQQTFDELIAVGDTVAITWEAVGVETVSIAASTRTAPGDGDYTAQITEVPVDAAVGSFDWIVTEAFTSPNVRIRISDDSHPDVRGFSAQVRARDPHRLVKVVTEDAGQRRYEMFAPSVHAWTFLNNEDPWWPESVRLTDSLYYRRRDIGYDPNYDGTEVRYAKSLFGNAITDYYPSWLSVTDAFGLQGAYAAGLTPAVVPDTLYNQASPAAVRWWTGHYESFDGACYGMSLTTLAAFVDPVRFMPIIDESAETLSEIGSMTPRIRGEVNARQLYQWDATTAGVETNMAGLLAFLKPLFESDDGAAVNRVLGLDGPMGGHAVVPYRIEDTGGASTRIYVYDPNFGGSDERFIYVDNATGSWTLVSAGIAWSRQDGGTLTLVGLTQTAYGTAEAPWTTGGGARTGGGGHDEVLVRGPSSSVTTPDGETVRYADGRLTGSAEGVRAVFELTGKPSRPVGYDLAPGTAYTFGVTSEPSALGAPSGLDVRRGSTWLGAEIPGTEPAGTFTAEIGPTGLLRFANAGTTTTAATLTALVKPDAGTERSWRVEGLQLGGGAGVASDVVGEADAFRISAPASATSYRLVVVGKSDAGVRSFEHAAVPLSGGSVHTIRPSWGMLDRAPVYVDVDADGDGDTDEILTLMNEGAVADEDSPTASPERPAVFALSAYPNPVRSAATVEVAVPVAQRVSVAVYDLLGRRVAVLHDGLLSEGTQVLRWDAGSLPSGVYVVRAAGETAVQTQRVTVVR